MAIVRWAAYSGEDVWINRCALILFIRGHILKPDVIKVAVDSLLPSIDFHEMGKFLMEYLACTAL